MPLHLKNPDNLRPGEVGYIISTDEHFHGDNPATIRAMPGTTNMRRNVLVHGWLGSTNDVSLTAMGVGRVKRILKSDEASVERILRRDEAEAASDLPQTCSDCGRIVRDGPCRSCG